MRWKAGEKIEVKATWMEASLDGVEELTTGSPYFRASFTNQTTGARLYDQGGSLAAGEVQFPLAYVAGVGWRAAYVIPTPPESGELTIEAIHPDHPVAIHDAGWVTLSDIDDVTTLVGQTSVQGDVVQEVFQPDPS